jgi:hypothetical protein
MNREFTCKCGALLNAIGSHFTNRLQPEPGDATICQYCGTWWIFEEVGVRLFTQTDYERLTDNEASHFNEATVRAMKRINGAQPG